MGLAEVKVSPSIKEKGLEIPQPAVMVSHDSRVLRWKDDQRGVVPFDVTDACSERSGVRVGVGKLFAGRRHCTVSVPVMFGWTVQTNAYVPASRAGTS